MCVCVRACVRERESARARTRVFEFVVLRQGQDARDDTQERKDAHSVSSRRKPSCVSWSQARSRRPATSAPSQSGVTSQQ